MAEFTSPEKHTVRFEKDGAICYVRADQYEGRVDDHVPPPKPTVREILQADREEQLEKAEASVRAARQEIEAGEDIGTDTEEIIAWGREQ